MSGYPAWEYCEAEFRCSASVQSVTALVHDFLNNHGKEGWEVVWCSVRDVAIGQVRQSFIFKRPKVMSEDTSTPRRPWRSPRSIARSLRNRRFELKQ